jgi:predicted secreted hydrolase
MQRRAWLLGMLLPMNVRLPAAASEIQPRTLVFPVDFGAHPGARIEWWYATGALEAESLRKFGFQLTFFRTRGDVADDHPSRFAAKQLVLAHAAVTDLAARRLRHDQRIARAGFDIARAFEGDTLVSLRDWELRREGPPDRSTYHARLHGDNAGFRFELALVATQPVLLQGDGGYSRKGPEPPQASHYYSQPQLQVTGRLAIDGATQAVRGTAWLDHEWSDAPLAAEAVGWDWIGMNLLDGSALTAFRLRRRDGSMLWAGGSYRTRDLALRNFGADEVHFTPGRTWRSAASQALYPMEWTIDVPAGRFRVRALLDAQELDSRGSTGSIYWEGLSELLDERDRVIGRGYLELTGYAAPLRL